MNRKATSWGRLSEKYMFCTMAEMLKKEYHSPEAAVVPVAPAWSVMQVASPLNEDFEEQEIYDGF